MPHMYTSIVITLSVANTHLIRTHKDFRAMLKLAKGRWVKTRN